ncbi:MAG: tetratricopeptide repeat protein [Thermoflavifilum aggregans]|nr:tetratricopeptide repeat protein [Thermoflavifilum aggregans]
MWLRIFMKWNILCVLVLACSLPVIASSPRTYDFNARCRMAYQLIMAMRVQEAQQLLNLEQKTHPENLIPVLLQNYIDFMQLFFDGGSADYQQKLANRNTYLSLLAQGSRDSPYYLLSQAIVHFQWSLIKVKFGDRISAAWEFRRAYLMLSDNQKRYPRFYPNDIFLGAMKTAIGTVPDGYRWITDILGMKGSIQQGMQMLKQVIAMGDDDQLLFGQEAYVYYCYLLFYIERNPEAVFRFIREKNLDTQHNQLYAFMVANLALNHHRSAYALQVLQDLNRQMDYLDMPSLDFELGTIYLNSLQADSAIRYLQAFLQRTKTEYYKKDALLRLSWAYTLKGNTAMANQCRQRILKEGTAMVDADKAALLEAQKTTPVDIHILRARLLSDGGYFRQALDELNTISAAALPDYLNKLMYAYFMARIYDEMGEDEKAIPYYQATIEAGRNLPEYYAARAAWQMGMIYEKRNQPEKALYYYNLCLQMPEKEYKNSLDQWAKAGIERIKGK